MRVIFAVFTVIAAISPLAETAGPETLSLPSLVRPFTKTNPLYAASADVFAIGAARVLKVTNLLSSGPGSLRAALQEKGTRLVVFEVGGVIDLAGASLIIEEPNVFIAGETAPPPGITLVRGSLIIETDHVVVRHLAVRPGDGRPTPGGPWQPDGITVNRDKRPAHHVLIENCSATWAVDENASVSGPRDTRPSAGPDATAHTVTFRNNLFAEALVNSTHAKGVHSMGLLIHDGIREIVIDGNLFAHNRERNPRLKGGVEAVVTNNVIYNWGSAAIGVGAKGNEEILKGVRAVVSGNVAIAGPDTKGRVLIHALDPGPSILASANVAKTATGGDLKEMDAGITLTDAPLSWAAAATTGALNAKPDAAATLNSVLRGAGARPAERDDIDRRIVEGVIAGTGRLIDSQEQVGGYPKREATRRSLTVPEGRAKRLEWLGQMMKALEFDPKVDPTPLLYRLKLPR